MCVYSTQGKRQRRVAVRDNPAGMKVILAEKEVYPQFQAFNERQAGFDEAASSVTHRYHA